MHNQLSHLSKEEIDNLITRYYAGEPVGKLIQEYGLNVRVADLYKLFPPEVCSDHLCKYCEAPLVIDRCSKTYSRIPRKKVDMYCPNCLHKPYQPRCTCQNCLDLERKIREGQVDLIRKLYDVQHEPIVFENLTFKNKVYLGALCRALMSENTQDISPWFGSGVKLAPTKELSLKVYEQLSDEDVIVVSPTSSVEAFDITDEDFPAVYYIERVTYGVNLVFPTNRQDLLTEILNPTYFSLDWVEEALEMWREIAVGECIEYLLYQLRNVKFEFNPGNKTRKVFEILLNDFSVSQIYGIIYKGVAEASKLYLEKGLNKRHAANTVISYCENFAERAKTKGWTLSQYNRMKDLPQSTLSLFFFNRVLGIGDNGFRKVPRIENLGRS